MTFIVIGSTAARLWLGDAWRAPKDLDVFTDLHHNDKNFDVLWDERFRDIWGHEIRYATLNELYTIKVSHAYWELKNGTWNKHMQDALRLKREGAELLPEMHKVLYDVWVDMHGKKRVDLNMDKASFFADAVPRVYDHDSIHASVAYGDAPVYESVLKDGAEVDVDMRRVKALPFDMIVKLFREEVYVTALERQVIPSNYTCSPKAAYVWALRRTITSLTKGWSARFMAGNYETFSKPDVDYVMRHRDNANKLVKFEGNDND